MEYANKNYIYVNYHWLDALRLLDSDEVGQIMLAMYDFVNGKPYKEPESKAAKVFWYAIKYQLEPDFQDSLLESDMQETEADEDIDSIESAQTIGGWISVKDRMPENADHPGAFCPRYLVMTKYGSTEGWYNPDHGYWYTLVWFAIDRYTENNIDMVHGDIPKVCKYIEVTHWMSLPEPPKKDRENRI